MPEPGAEVRPPRWVSHGLGAAAILSALALAFVDGVAVPLGWPSEWTWHRSRPPGALTVVPAALGLLAFVAFACWGRRRIAAGGRSGRWLAGLLLAGLGVQWLLVELPAPGFGMERWPLALQGKASSGYFARAQALADGRTGFAEFLRGYQTWLKDQDSFHMGTHPPGLFALPLAALQQCRANPKFADAVLAACPERFRAGFAHLRPAPAAADQAALALLAGFAWFCVWLAALPVWALARWRGNPESAFAAAALWLLTPGPLLFLPLGDVLYPVVAAGWVWLAVQAADRRSAAAAFLLGGLAAAAWLAGMFCSLAFVATLPIAGLAAILARGPRTAWAMAGFVLSAAALLAAANAWGLDQLGIWRTNLAKHAGFYDAFPRSYRVWVWLDLVEFAAAAGPPAFLCWLFAAVRPRRAPLTAAGMLTLLALDASGKNLSEVARLWVFLMPFAAAGAGPLATRCLPAALCGQAFAAALLLARVEPLLPVALAD